MTLCSLLFELLSKVKFEDGHFPRDSGRRWCYICEVWSLKFEDVLTNIFYQPICFNQYIFSLCMNFILPTILSIQKTLIFLSFQSWEKSLLNTAFLFTYYYPHSLSSLIFFKTEKKKITCKTLSVNMNFPTTRFLSLPCP